MRRSGSVIASRASIALAVDTCTGLPAMSAGGLEPSTIDLEVDFTASR